MDIEATSWRHTYIGRSSWVTTKLEDQAALPRRAHGFDLPYGFSTPSRSRTIRLTRFRYEAVEGKEKITEKLVQECGGRSHENENLLKR